MRNEKGFSEKCFQPLPGAAGVVGIGLAVMFPPGAEPKMDDEVLKKHPHLKRTRADDGFRVYLPPVGTESAEGMTVLFEAWVDLTQARQAKIILRKEGWHEVFCGRLRETQSFPFDRPEEGLVKYIELDFMTRREKGKDPRIDYACFFEPVFMRIQVAREKFAYVRIGAKVDSGVPVVTVTGVSPGVVPRHLLPPLPPPSPPSRRRRH